MPRQELRLGPVLLAGRRPNLQPPSLQEDVLAVALHLFGDRHGQVVLDGKGPEVERPRGEGTKGRAVGHWVGAVGGEPPDVGRLHAYGGRNQDQVELDTAEGAAEANHRMWAASTTTAEGIRTR